MFADDFYLFIYLAFYIQNYLNQSVVSHSTLLFLWAVMDGSSIMSCHPTGQGRKLDEKVSYEMINYVMREICTNYSSSLES